MSTTLVDACTLYLQIEDPEVVAELQRRQEGAERDRYAVSALRLGVLALRDARGALDADTIRQEGERLLAQVGLTLNTHASEVTTAVGAGLKQYLDPTTGVLNERLERLVKNDGDLDVLLGKHFASDTGALARTLADHVGKASPLYKLLSPEEQGGFLRSLETSVNTILDAQRQKVIDEFDLNQPESALSRLKREVTSANHQLGQNFSANVDAVKAQFSLDDKNSALSRLVAQVDAAQKKITTEFSLDDDKSALSRLRHELLGHVQHIQKIVTGLQARKEEAALSTRHGGTFEDAVCELLAEEARDLGDIGTSCGTTVGRISYCKVGDFTAELGPESSAPGKLIVVEAKAEKGYSISDALAELATARDNRGAEVGLFVFAKACAPTGLRPLTRYGTDVLVVWDVEDVTTDLYLRAGYSVARALVIATAKADDDRGPVLTEIETCVAEIRKNAEDLEDILEGVKTIGNANDKIEKRAKLAKKRILEQTEQLQDSLQSL